MCYFLTLTSWQAAYLLVDWQLGVEQPSAQPAILHALSPAICSCSVTIQRAVSLPQPNLSSRKTAAGAHLMICWMHLCCSYNLGGTGNVLLHLKHSDSILLCTSRNPPLHATYDTMSHCQPSSLNLFHLFLEALGVCYFLTLTIMAGSLSSGRLAAWC